MAITQFYQKNKKKKKKLINKIIILFLKDLKIEQQNATIEIKYLYFNCIF
jgi:hypothetical protein